ncbi:MAG TPA: hypothetical protein P5204_01355 [Kiritimatiellia bacterium]|nr:hypothetical protein [Kiritimatiellia bacterium]
MPGLHAVLHCLPDGDVRFRAAVEDQKSDPAVRTDVLWEQPGRAAAFSGHAAYPRRFWRIDGARIFLEGAVYNQTGAETDARLAEIAASLLRGADVAGPVRRFMEETDGDYVVVVQGETKPEMIAFNDRWGRLPAYYCRTPGSAAFSRTVSFLLHWLPEIRLDPRALAEFLMMGYVLGAKTLVEGITRLEPGSLLRMAVAGPETAATAERICPGVFGHGAAVEPGRAAAICADLFIRGLENRVRFCRESGLRITVDVTAGRDSRTNYVGLSRLGAAAEYFSDDLDAHNECDYLPALVAIYGNPVAQIPMKTPPADFAAMRRLTYCTDCTVNGWTAHLAEHKTLERKRQVPGPAIRFMGFGGELIRTIFRPPYLYTRMSQLIRDNVYFHIFELPDVCRLLGLDPRRLARDLEGYVAAYPESSLDDKPKRFYFEYYQVLVNAGENRQRRHFWTMAPLWAQALVTYEMAELPTAILNHAFFDRFLEQIDSRATQAPFYRRGADAGTKASLVGYWLGKQARKLAGGWPLLPWSRKIKRLLRGEHRKLEVETPLEREIRTTWESTPVAARYFSRAEILRIATRRANPVKKYQLLTVLQYLSEVASRFPVQGPLPGRSEAERP